MAKKAVNKKSPKPRKKPVKRKSPKKRAPNGLTIKQEKFCHVYMETGNASEAYRQVYSTGNMKPETINRKAKYNLDLDKIRARLLQLKEELKEVSNIKKERLLYELEAIATAKITDYVEIKIVFETVENEAGEPIRISKPVITFKDFSKLTDQQIRAIEGIKQGRYGPEITLHGKNWTTERIAKMLGYDAPKKLNIDGAGLGVIILEPRNDG